LIQEGDKKASFARPIWDRGDPIDEQMMRFTIGDDWLQDRRLVELDIEGSLAHVDGLLRAELVEEDDCRAIVGGLHELLAEFRAGDWTVESTDEDVHSAVERRLIEKIGPAGKRLHTGRSRNDQIALDLRLWLRQASIQTKDLVGQLCGELRRLVARNPTLPLPGYTHLRRAMPSNVSLWGEAHAAAFEESLSAFMPLSVRLRRCPLGSGAGYGVDLKLDRRGVALALGFEGPEEPVTLTQNTRGRAELAYLTALESIALDLAKLASDLWLFTSEEFGFARLPNELTTGSSMMPQKRNPDVVELLRAHMRQVVAERSELMNVQRDLPSGYHRDFQLIKPPLFRAHDRMLSSLAIAVRVIAGLTFVESRLREVSADPGLLATQRALERVKEGVAFRDAYRVETADKG
jgi:argininosuccinate lyase